MTKQSETTILKKMEQLPGWKYKFSESLNQTVGYNPKTGWIQCEDGTAYSPEENRILSAAKKTTPLTVHLIKKLFQGVVVSAPLPEAEKR